MMTGTRNLFAAVLLASSSLLAPLAALAQAPFQFGGLHTDLIFSDAVTKVQQLGATCNIKQSKSVGGGVSANCVLLPCTVGTTVGVCQEQHTLPTKLAIASQPVITIGLDAPAESAPLQRITFLFDGSVDTMAKTLIEQFGPPTSDGTTSAQQGWSHSQRRSWTSGNYNLGLMNSPNMVILTANPPAPDTVER